LTELGIDISEYSKGKGEVEVGLEEGAVVVVVVVAEEVVVEQKGEEERKVLQVKERAMREARGRKEDMKRRSSMM